MRWEQTEFLLKGLYLGLLLVVALHDPTWTEIGLVAGCTFAGLAVCLAVAGYRKVREGFSIQGRWVGFILFLLLENPGMVYAGVLVGLTVGATVAFHGHPLSQDNMWFVFGPVLGGAALGVLFWYLRIVRDRRLRNWLGLALATILIGGALLLLNIDLLDSAFLSDNRRFKIGVLMLLGIPGFYLLTLASLVEESEVEIAAMCAALGVGLAFLGQFVSWVIALAVPLTLYYVYTRRVLPGLRVFKHVLRGISYGKLGNVRLALASLNRAVQLNPQHRLAHEQLWGLHRRVDFDQYKDDPETLAMVNYGLCLERVAWLLLQSPVKPEQTEEATRLLDLVASQRPALAPPVAYWRAVAHCHRRNLDDAARELAWVLQPPELDTPQRRAILFQAWQLAILLHPEMKRRVGEPLLGQPGRRLEAIAAVERQLNQKPDDPAAWDLKRMLYADLSEADYNAAVAPDQAAADFNHEYVQQLGLALIEDPQRWQRGCEYLRMAARGLPAQAPAIYIQIGKTHDKFGDPDGLWRNYRQAMLVGKAIGPANLSEQDRTLLFGVVKLLGEMAMKEGRIDDALDAFKFYAQYDRAGLETYRTLAELFERKGQSEPEGESRQRAVWMALHCTEHALTYDPKDADLLARKDRYYYSLSPEALNKLQDGAPKWFDFDYCLGTARKVVDHFSGNLDNLDWASHLADLAQAAYPSSHAARLVRARVSRLRGEVNEAVNLLEEIRQHKPEKFANEGERNAWFLAHRMLGDMYLNEKPDQAILCFQEFRTSDHAGADTVYKMGVAYENLGDRTRAVRCYKNVTAYEDHPLFFEARDALGRLGAGE